MSGEAAEWANIAPQSFFLEPGEVKQIDQFINVPCRKKGEFLLNTTIKTLFDLEKTLEQNVKISNCANVQIIPLFSGAQQECPCTPVQYGFEVANTGNHVEMYEISVEPYSEAITLSTDFLVLEPGERETIDVFINLACGEYGERIFTFNAFAKGTGILGQTDFVLDIDKCYEYEVVVGTEYGICQGVPNIIPISVDNQADIANEYFLNVEGAEWAHVENETVAAWGGEVVDSNILLFPPVEDEGLYTITLESLSVRGEEQRVHEILLESEKCYDYQLIETEGVFEAVECKAKDHVFVLKNIGSRAASYYIDLEGFDWLTTTASIEPVVLAPGEEAEVVMSGQTPCDVFGEFLENVYVTIDEVNQTYVEEKVITIYAKEEAYLPQVEFEDLKIGYEGGETEIQITNTGFQTATYDLSLFASDWITIDTSSVLLGPGQNATVMLQAYPTEDVWQDVYAGELIVSVAGEGVEYSLDFLVELKQEYGTPLWIILTAGGAVLLLLIAIIVLAILLSKKKKPKKKEEKEEKKPEKTLITIDKREYAKKKKEEKKTPIWPVFLIIAIALLLGAGAYYAVSSGMIDLDRNETVEEVAEPEPEPIPEPEEVPSGVLTKDDIQESLITIDRSGVAGEGNVLLITNETEINLPLSIKNPTDRKAKFTVNTPEEGWVQFEHDTILVLPDSIKIINVKIIPDLEALEKNDYAVTINTTLEGKKIFYEETLDFVLSKKRSWLEDFWPWIAAGLVALALIIAIIILSSKKKPFKKAAKKEKKAVDKEKPKKATKTKLKKEGLGWGAIVAGIVGIIILIALGIWAYNTFIPTDSEEIEQVDVVPDETEETEETQETEEKLTEDDIEESLITIDRNAVPGSGTVLEVDAEEYILPLSIKNPTDRKARFEVSTNNESWIVFDHYIILVEPESIKEVEMKLVPDMDALKESDYVVTINTRLEGKKIDYKEELAFVVKEKKSFGIGFWAYALAGIVLLGLIILAAELLKHRKAAPAKKKKVKKVKKIVSKDKNIADINKELAVLRKKTVLKLKKASY
jgi:cytoskeletal protein RodZ